jgi:hypothetical protein
MNIDTPISGGITPPPSAPAEASAHGTSGGKFEFALAKYEWQTAEQLGVSPGVTPPPPAPAEAAGHGTSGGR